MSLAPAVSLGDVSLAGQWKIFARPAGDQRVEISSVRGVPLIPDEFSFADPYGATDLSMALPMVSVYDRLGQGDLSWLRKKVGIDVMWYGLISVNYPWGTLRAKLFEPMFAWEGQATAFSVEDGTLGMTCKGAMFQLDDYLAKPEYLHRPLPYEQAISRQFLHRGHLRLTPMHIMWPSWWDKKYAPPAKGTPDYLIPTGLKRGDNWLEMVTRSTGAWEPVLTSYIQTLLNSMYTRTGRWTLDLQPGRVPVLLHRDMLERPNAGTAVLDIVSDAVEINELEMDWSQSLDVVYGSGQSLAGVSYSGMQVTSDGERTYYLPLAYSRQAYPDAASNEWRKLSEMPREVMVPMLTGLDEYEASRWAQAHLERFGDPGITGSATISGDVPLYGGGTIPHHLVRAGMSIQLKSLLGFRQGVMAHISQSTSSIRDGNTKVTFDSRYRDSLTVDEVRVRGRDSLAVNRMLIGGQYAPPLPDMLLPWNYAEGSGQIPYGPMTQKFFDEMPDDEQFPWTNWTTKHPPKGKWHDAYIEIKAASRNADKNWAGRPLGSKTGQLYAIPIKLAQAGTIRLLQIAAYDKFGNVMKVPFHVSFYYYRNVSVQSMPKIPAYQPNQHLAGYYPYHHPPFQVKQHYPYVKAAFEEYNLDGTQKGTEVPQAVHTAGLWKAYGNDAIKAGYFPRDGRTGRPTGLLVDEVPQSFDFTSQTGFNVFVPRGNLGLDHGNNPPGFMYAMVYCDAQGARPVYFLGRMFRQEPGSQGNAG